MSSRDQPANATASGKHSGAKVAFEAAAWTVIGAGWRPLFGHFKELGLSFEWHEFELTKPLDWARSFHANSLELCLNLSGEASITCNRNTVSFDALTAGFYFVGDRESLVAVRHPGPQHRFLTIELSREFLTTRLRDYQSGLHPLVRLVVERGEPKPCAGLVEPLSPIQVELINSLRTPPVAAQAQRLWFESKAGELIAHLLFRPQGEDFFCTRQHRVARERTSRVIEVLKRDLAEPPSLEAIGREIGCSPYYLSRTFSSQMGVTIPQYLRKLRMQRAAVLLASGQRNVTEAAMEVGYASLSHFSSAFREIYGCCPGLYPIQHSPLPEGPR